MEALNKAYGVKGVSFYNVLSREPHPGFYGFQQPDSLKERKEYVRLADAELQMEIPWIIDNTMQKTYGRMPNSEFIIDPDGVLLESREWADPTKLKAGKRRRGEDVYPHTLGILWTLKDGAAQMAFKATVRHLLNLPVYSFIYKVR